MLDFFKYFCINGVDSAMSVSPSSSIIKTIHQIEYKKHFCNVHRSHFAG